MFGKFKKPEIPELKIDFGADWEAIQRAALFEPFESEPAKKPVVEEEKWIWVEGFKGVNADMTAWGGFQYEIGKEYQMDEDAQVRACYGGFHLCPDLNDVFRYYHIGNGNRFFKVKALVRATDYEKESLYYDGYRRLDKLAAKSIILERELTLDEIFYSDEFADWTEDEKKLALATSPRDVYFNRDVAKLIEAGYSEPFSTYIATHPSKIKMALVMASQPGVSMDMKVFAIMYEKCSE